MSASATVRVQSAEAIAAQAAHTAPFVQWPEATTVFAERAMRLRQLAKDHPMADFLNFAAQMAQAQQGLLQSFAAVPLPDAAALDKAALAGLPPLGVATWQRDPAWRTALRQLVQSLQAQSGGTAALQQTLAQLAEADDDTLERQADALLLGEMHRVNMAWSSLVAAALQVYWTHLLVALPKALGLGANQSVIGRVDDLTRCPCCGSLPVTSLTQTVGHLPGQRYLHCSLCNLQWHMVRSRCTHCLSTRDISFQSLAHQDADEAEAARAAVQAETCGDCGHYLKIIHKDLDAFVEPVADDLASLTLDLLVAEAGLQRHGVNLWLLFGESDEPEPPPEPLAAPPKPGAH
ncbi:MAG: formate dehydrogenase accessory protein FdhE [Ideonella sp. MAG2]|nr:MAG: formate dehydrogenase accessory protein FdhE [Ideonella sp. MAG2]